MVEVYTPATACKYPYKRKGYIPLVVEVYTLAFEAVYGVRT